MGAAGFIGTNLALALYKQNELLLVDSKEEYFVKHPIIKENNVKIHIMHFDRNAEFSEVLQDTDVIFRLISTNNPTTSNKDIGTELEENVALKVNILEVCKKTMWVKWYSYHRAERFMERANAR